MSPEFRVVIHQREGKSIKQLYIDKQTLLANRVKITANHFGCEVQEIVDVLEDVKNVILYEQKPLFSEEERSKYSGRDLDLFFESKLRNLGISYSHSRNLVIGVVNHFALASSGRYKSERWWGARNKFLEKLHQKIS